MLLALVLALVSASSCQKKEILFQQGKGEMDYTCTTADGEKTIHLYYYIPEGDIASMPVQIVMHGMGRNGDGYFNVWVQEADKYGCILLVPTFSDEQFAEESYQQGNILNAEGKFNRKEDMTYAIVDGIFDFFLDHSTSKAKKFNIYGHSAGAQFVHRYLMFGDPKVTLLSQPTPDGTPSLPTLQDSHTASAMLKRNLGSTLRISTQRT